MLWILCIGVLFLLEPCVVLGSLVCALFVLEICGWRELALFLGTCVSCVL